MRQRYKQTFLKKVVARVDFTPPVEILKKTIPSNVSKLLLRAFPISEPKKIIGKKLMITRDETKESTREETYWFYHSKNRQKRAVLAPEFFLTEYDVYSSFENLLSDFLPILGELFTSIEELSVQRLGLRYIDHITFDENGDLFDWSAYLHNSLLAAFSIPHDGKQIIRAFNNFTITDEDMILSFQYGMHNPDFPAPIKKKLFILDSDAYTQGFLELKDTEDKLNKFHEAIGSLFEQVITDKLREIMEPVNAE